MTYAYIGLGSNSGSRQRHLQAAARRLKKLPGAKLTALAPIYQTAPLGCPGQQPPYLNTVAELQTLAPPQRLFRRLRQLEKSIQKKARAKNAARRLDADYLSHGSCRLRAPLLTLPHPRLYQRAFVLQPLLDILARADAPRPLNAKRLRDALAHCRRQQHWQRF